MYFVSLLFMVKGLGSYSGLLQALRLLYPKLHPQPEKQFQQTVSMKEDKWYVKQCPYFDGSECHKAIGYTCYPSGKAKGIGLRHNSTQAVSEDNQDYMFEFDPRKRTQATK